jgi:hypothetical protein
MPQRIYLQWPINPQILLTFAADAVVESKSWNRVKYANHVKCLEGDMYDEFKYNHDS